MARPWILTSILFLLGIALWSSDEFTTVAAGIAVFLFGMIFLKDGFTAFTGGVLEKFLRASTGSLFKSHLFGIVSTSVMQSSSLVSVITISFLSAGLIGLTSGLGIVFGANIGTTTGAWLMAAFGMKVKISAYAMPMLIFGLILTFQKHKTLKGIGAILTGMGFLFLGIHFMKEGFDGFKDSIHLSQYAVGGVRGLFIFTGLGVLATVIMQSSHATLMLIIAALASGQVTYDNALALAIGANIGTTVTAILGAISANAAGRRLAGGHLIFNSVTALLAIAFMAQFKWTVDEVSSLVGIAADDWTLKLAVFHTLFNLVGVLVMVPAIPALVRFLERWVEDADEFHALQPIYLNDAALELPDTALEVLIKETGHLFDNAFEIIAHGLNTHRHDILSKRPLDVVVASTRKPFDLDVMQGYQESIKVIYNAIIEFATKVRNRGSMTDEQQEEIDSIRITCRLIAEVIRDVSNMRNNLVRYLNSDNEHIDREYDLIRLRITTILRDIYQIRESTDEVMIYMTLTDLMEDLQKADVLANGTLDRLVRDGLITDRMATSLMNDSAYARNISDNLIEIAQRLFIAEGTDLREVGDDLLQADERPTAGLRA